MRTLAAFVLWSLFLGFNSYLRHSTFLETFTEVQISFLKSSALSLLLLFPFSLTETVFSLHSHFYSSFKFLNAHRKYGCLVVPPRSTFPSPKLFICLKPEIKILPISWVLQSLLQARDPNIISHLMALIHWHGSFHAASCTPTCSRHAPYTSLPLLLVNPSLLPPSTQNLSILQTLFVGPSFPQRLLQFPQTNFSLPNSNCACCRRTILPQCAECELIV